MAKQGKKSRAGKKSASKNSTLVAQQTVEEPVAQEVVAAPVAQEVVAAPVAQEAVAPPVAAPVAQEASVVQKGAGKRAKKTTKKTAAPAETVAAAETVAETAAETADETADETTTVQTVGGKRVRSFKVMLPGNESYEGRFTGLTPYQAANKALSKYYRETSKPKKQIQFSIRESTRGSKRGVYTYNGKREKLDTPVEYAIKDGRTIVKKFKNRLTKVKKADLPSVEV